MRTRVGLVLCGTAVAVAVWMAPSVAEAQIKSPGASPNGYSVEVEPHLLFQWDMHYAGWASHSGWGPGLRVAIPLMENGPINKINNNFAIGFGFDWAHDSTNCWGWWNNARYAGGKCTANDFWFPVVLQWNFFIHKKFSAFGEPGLAIRHSTWSNSGYYNGVPGEYKSSDTSLEPVFAGGGRVHFTDKVAFAFRLGWPYASLGVSILF